MSNTNLSMRYYITCHSSGHETEVIFVNAFSENEAIEALLAANPEVERCNDEDNTSGFVMYDREFWIDSVQPLPEEVAL